MEALVALPKSSSRKLRKVRKNVMFTKEGIRKVKVIKRFEKRPSVSNTVEALINREYNRLLRKKSNAA